MTPNIWIPYIAVLVHILADFGLQTDWMAMNKNKSTKHCLVHVLIYTACFLLLTLSWKALLFIGATHFLLDRWGHKGLKRLIWLRNHFPTGKYPPWRLCDSTGYYDTCETNSYYPLNEHALKRYGNPRPKEITWWLYIIHDNALHLFFNMLALVYFN